MIAPGLIVFLLWTGQGAGEAPVLVAGQDVEAPTRLYSRPPDYPVIARQAELQGLIVLAVTVNEEGRPMDIEVLRGIPLLDGAAIDAIKKWRYAPTAVDGVRRRVKFIEHVGFYLSDRDRVKACTSLAQERRYPTPLRLWAIAELLQVPRKHRKGATEALTVLLNDPDAAVAKAAKVALAQLAEEQIK